MKDASPSYLKHHFLIAMPQMRDPNFAQTVTYVVEHNAEGAMGLVINRPSGLSLADVIDQLEPDLQAIDACQHLPIFSGGPVQTERGFVLHPSGPQFQATSDLGSLGLSTSQDVLFAIAQGHGPQPTPDCPWLRRLGGWAAGGRTGRQCLADLPGRPAYLVRHTRRAAPNSGGQQPRGKPQPAQHSSRSRLMATTLKLLLGFDYGTKQIGVAVGQAITGQARELCILKAQNGVPDWQKVEALLREWQPDAIVVGLPLNMDGSPSDMSERAEKFARRLNGRFNLPVHTQDERLTTYEAKGQRIGQGGQQGSYRDNPVDALAAALLLESWLAAYSENQSNEEHQ